MVIAINIQSEGEHMLKTGSIFTALFFILTSLSTSLAGDHPEDHPAGEQSQITTRNIADAIRAHVEEKSRKNDGYFIVEDKKGDKMLYLKLDKIHMERLSAVENNIYFACVDFTNRDGRAYDIDFFLKDKGGKLKVTETIVHKEEGKPRYNWAKQGDFWIRKPLD